jgi:hypothetical protein
MANYPAKPWTDGQRHEIYDDKIFEYNATTGNWTYVPEVVEDSEINTVEILLARLDSDIQNIDAGTY